MTKSKERRRLLKLYDETGDDDYRRAAECLRIPLLERLTRIKPGRRGQTVGKEARPRLYRMARMIAEGASVLAAARREVDAHGYRPHPSKETAIDYLRSAYRENRESIEADLAAGTKMVADQNQLITQAETSARQLRDIERQVTKMPRIAQQYMPPAWTYTVQRHVLPWWVRDLGTITRGVGRQMLGWRNTLPKIGEKRSNDRGATR